MFCINFAPNPAVASVWIDALAETGEARSRGEKAVAARVE